MTGTARPARSEAPSPALPAGGGSVAVHVTGAVASAVFALAWLALSWWHPALTYHFGPPLAAAAWPVLLRARLRHATRRGQALVAVGGGFVVAVAALGVATAADWLRGPTLIGTGSVPAEEVVLAVIAAAWGWRVAARRKRAWFLPAEPADRAVPPAEP
jgi:hypothetical protein